MKNVVSVAFCILSFICCIAQKKEKKDLDIFKINAGWYEGSIVLSDGQELTGVVQYNDQTGILSFKDGDEDRSFRARSIRNFNFFDERYQRHRYFYTLEYEDSKDNVKRPLFFELVKDCEEFVVVSKIDPVTLTQGYDPLRNALTPEVYWGKPTGGVKNIFEQEKIVYIVNKEMAIEPYLRVKYKEVDGYWLDSRKTRSKFLNKNLLAEYTGAPMYKKLKIYAKENKLHFDRMQGLMQILDYYMELKP